MERDSHPAGFWIRFLADVIDSALIYMPAGMILAAATAALGSESPVVAALNLFGGAVISGVYYTWTTGSTGQTLGKKLCELTVVRDDGSPVGYGLAFGRWCAYGLSYLTLTIGFMMAGWNADKKALHDYVAGTRVIRRGPAPVGGTPAWKIALGVGGALVLALALAVGGFVWWLQENQDRLKAEGDATKEEAKAFAQGADQAGCVAEARRRLAGAGFMAQARNKIFLGACLEAAAPTAGFCEGVPPEGGIMATVAYRLEKCADAPEADRDACGRLLDEVQEHCDKARKEAP